jgi:ABC-type branched-subunit amino acid transport system ATPase component
VSAAPAVGELGPARLEIEGVVVSFGGVQAVDRADLIAEPGAIVGLIGPNGSGKTTMLDVVSGLVPPQGGSVRLDGESLVEYLPEERAALGVVRSFQDCRLFPELTVEEVLLLTEDARRPVGILSSTLQMPWARRSERSKRAAVDEVIGRFGIDRFRRHQIAQLSTGTRRVVDLASIVLARPRLLLLDEPTAGIAQREAEAFVPLLRRLHQGGDDGDRQDRFDRDPRRGPEGPSGSGRLPGCQRGGVGGVRSRGSVFPRGDRRRVGPFGGRRPLGEPGALGGDRTFRGVTPAGESRTVQLRGMAGPKGTSPWSVTRWAMRVSDP